MQVAQEAGITYGLVSSARFFLEYTKHLEHKGLVVKDMDAFFHGLGVVSFGVVGGGLLAGAAAIAVVTGFGAVSAAIGAGMLAKGILDYVDC